MRIDLHPQRRDDTLALTVSGDVLTINGQDFDFSGVTDGAILPRDAVACDLIAGDVTRQDGQLIVPLILPIGPNASEAQRFPTPIIVTEDGPIVLPEPESETANAE